MPTGLFFSKLRVILTLARLKETPLLRVMTKTIFFSHSPAQTRELGKTWGEQLSPGWVIGLQGELGAGKTELVKGLAIGLGFPGRVHSPTFNLINEYLGGRLPLFHLDLYRLAGALEIKAAGLEEFIERPEALSVIEWAERWPQDSQDSLARCRRYRQVVIEDLAESQRRIIYEDFSS